MDKLWGTIGDCSTMKQYLEIINQTTDDYLFMLDIQNGEIEIFGNFSEYFDLSATDSTQIPLREILNVIHVADKRMMIAEISKIRCGETDTHNMDFRMYNRSGNIVWVNSRGKVLHDDNGVPYLMIGRISEEAVRHLFDPLTGLWNKTKLRGDLNQRFNDRIGWLMMLEIPMLTDIYLSHGKSFGNQLLRDVAGILEAIDSAEGVYHTEHNNFAMILNDSSEQSAEAIFRKINHSLQDRCSLYAGVVPIDANVFLDISQLIDCANITLKKASQNPISGIDFFSAEEIQQRINSLMLLEEMKESVQNGFEGFEIHYQPQIKSGSYELHGVEALLRYNSPRRGRVFPDEFIPLLEQSVLIDPVGMWVLETALAQCKKWRENLPELQIAVNFSSVQFEDHLLGEKIVDVLKKVQLPGQALTVELTESVQLVANEHFYHMIKFIKAYGVRFSIDDFGAGYSNLRYLKQLEVNEIKIDRSFVSEIEMNTYNYRLVRNMLEFAKTNAIYACCEGVETARELSILEPLQADIFQGYLFDKPCTSDDIAEKYIDINSDAYKARIAAITEINRYKDQFGSIYFDPKNILHANEIGLWIIRIDKSNNRHELYVDEVMEHVLGLTEKMSPVDCFNYWSMRILDDDKDYVTNAFQVMEKEGRAVQLRYHWMHPTAGFVSVRSSGIRTSDDSGKIIIEGFHRILTGVEGE